ncbi:protein CMSS1 isoform X2 [Heptranchias perlo]|uniref:protein CMSS1 isoform X2 n=1 Tax=Heptranchias perlo TaxID=212740 RepID=UPI00355A5600
MSQDAPEHNIKRKRKKRDEITQPATVKKSKKQTECFIDTKVEEKPEASPPKKKRRRKISAVLANSAPKPAVPADLQNMIIQHFKNERSVIELEELKLPDSCFLQSNDLTHTLSSYLKQVCPKWVKLCKNHTEKKSVLMLIICSSALRALEMIRLLTAFKGKDCKTFKLFAKHIKVEEQIKWLTKGVIHLGVGTPGRIRNLIEQDGLSLQSLKYVILDWNWHDQKLRRLMDIPEVKQETLKLLETSIVPICKSGSVKLGLF